MSYLTIIASDGKSFRRDIDSDCLKIGRSSKNDVNLSFDLSLSRFHAEVTRRNGAFYVADVGSRNGTSLNGKPVMQPQELNVGDRITLGETTILFSAEQEPRVAIEDSPALPADSSTMTIPLEDILSAPPSPITDAPTSRAQDAESRTLAVLTRAGMELINYRPLDEVLEVIMDLVFEAIPGERGFMMLLEGDSKELVSKVVRDLIQDEIARGIVEQLRVRLGLEQAAAPLAARPTDDLEAYQLYLRGREAAYVRTPASLRRAIEYFRQALARDPDVARAHLGLAEAYIGLGVYQFIPTVEAAREAEEALHAAERLQPDLALVHVHWGQLKLYLRPDWHEAGPHFERALAIDPREPLAYAYLGTLNGMLGNLEAAMAATARAIALDPLSLFIRLVSVMGYPVRGIPGADSTAALAGHEAALAMDPNSYIHLWMSAVRLADLGRHDEAVPCMARAVELTRRAPLLVGLYARALALAGRRAEALALREELVERSRHEYIGPAAMLMMVGLDLEDEAATAALIETNVAEMTGPVAIATTVARELEPLLDHPRLGPVARKLTLWATSPLYPRSGPPET